MGLLTGAILAGATAVAGLGLGADAGVVAGELTRRCAQVETVAVAPPGTPLAARTEVHMRCLGVLGGGSVDDADFLLADGRLRLIELRGVDLARWVSARAEGEGRPVADYVVYADDWLVLGAGGARAWVLNGDALRDYAFLQADPFADRLGEETPGLPVMPVELAPEASFEEVAAGFTRACRSHAIRELDPADHPLTPASHVRIDCYGYPLLGFPRLVEAVFADGALSHVRTFIGARELPRQRMALRRHYGEPVRAGDGFEVFGDGEVAVRLSDTEILFMSPEVSAFFTGPTAAEAG
jgi:hypothetical protein